MPAHAGDGLASGEAGRPRGSRSVTRHARILLAGPDVAVLDFAQRGLTATNHEIRRCLGILEITSAIEAFRPDVVVLDVVDPDPTQITAVVRRAHASYRPLLLCLLDRRADLCDALAAGADACLTRPFTDEELEIHVAALVRRAPSLARAVHQIGPLVVDEDARLVMVADQPISLTARELDVLIVLLRHAGTVVSKRVLLERLWTYDAFDENLVEVHISALRRRLPPSARELIHTVRGAGYIVRAPAPQGRSA